MARIVEGGRRAVIDPLKHSQPLGGALALLGVARCMPLLHGAQGCTAFAKALLTRHFREPIPLQTTAITEVSAILGAGDSLRVALATIADRHAPDVIGVLTTGVTEVSGVDLMGELPPAASGGGSSANGSPGDASSAGGPLIVAAATPDFRGGLSDGWAAVLHALVTAVPGAGDGSRAGDGAGAGDGSRGGAGAGALDPGLVAVPAGVSLSAVDLDEIADLVRAFGLRPILVPDLSRSLDGHLADEGWTPLTTGGTTVAELRALAGAGTVLSVGASAEPAGAALAARSGAGYRGYPHASGLAAVDALVADLMERSGATAPERVRHARRRLADGLLDSHFVLGGTRVAVAAEPEYLAAVTTLLAEAGAEIVAAVSPTVDPVLAGTPADEVVVGDLADLEERAAEAGAELVVASSHARGLAERLGVAHLVAGFPVYDRLGAQLRGSSGYRGSLHLLFEAANRLLDHRSSGHTGPAGHSGPAGPAGRAGRAGVEECAAPVSHAVIEGLPC